MFLLYIVFLTANIGNSVVSNLHLVSKTKIKVSHRKCCSKCVHMRFIGSKYTQLQITALKAPTTFSSLSKSFSFFFGIYICFYFVSFLFCYIGPDTICCPCVLTSAVCSKNLWINHTCYRLLKSENLCHIQRGSHLSNFTFLNHDDLRWRTKHAALCSTDSCRFRTSTIPDMWSLSMFEPSLCKLWNTCV